MNLSQNSRFFITGAGSGIGAATARLAAKRGHRVVLADIDRNSIDSLARSLGENALAVPLDVRDADQWATALDSAVERFGGVDVLVNNAGVLYCGWLAEMKNADFQHMLDVNLYGVLNGMRASLPRFRSQGRGHVVNVGSVAGFIPVPGQAFYAATKHALRAVHHAFAFENRDAPVHYTLVCPGAVETPMIEQMAGREAGALAFADPALSPEQVAETIYRSVEKKQIQVIVPGFRGGFLRTIGGFPGLVLRVLPGAFKSGLKNMAGRGSLAGGRR